MFGLALGIAAPLLLMAVGAVYALYLDPKSTLPRGDRRRLL